MGSNFFKRGILFVFISGFFFASAIHIWSDYDYENGILEAIVFKINANKKDSSVESFVETSLHYVNKLQNPMTEIAYDGNYNFIKEFTTPPSFTNYYFGKGACGSYASFYCRVLNKAGYKSYPVQLKSADNTIKHIAVCIERQDKRFLVDPLFNHAFKDNNNRLSDIRNVSKSWFAYYIKHLPSNYPIEYNYQYGWSYTNWEKYGSISKDIKKGLVFIFGKERINNFSFRYYIFGYNRYIAYACLVLGFVSLVAVLKSTSKQHHQILNRVTD